MMSAMRWERLKLATMVVEDSGDRIGFSIALETVNSLGRIASTLHRLYVAGCNRPLTEKEKSDRERLESRATGIVRSFGAGFGLEISDDPRGAPLKLILPSGRSNSFGGVGVIVPFTAYKGE